MVLECITCYLFKFMSITINSGLPRTSGRPQYKILHSKVDHGLFRNYPLHKLTNKPNFVVDGADKTILNATLNYLDSWQSGLLLDGRAKMQIATRPGVGAYLTIQPHRTAGRGRNGQKNMTFIRRGGGQKVRVLPVFFLNQTPDVKTVFHLNRNTIDIYAKGFKQSFEKVFSRIDHRTIFDIRTDSIMFHVKKMSLDELLMKALDIKEKKSFLYYIEFVKRLQTEVQQAIVKEYSS